MAIFSRYAKVLNADDSPMTVKEALQDINAALDTFLSEQEAEYDAYPGLRSPGSNRMG